MLIPLYLLAASYAIPHNVSASRPLPPLPLTACSIVTRTDVEDAIVSRVSGGKEDSEGPVSSCDYAAKGGLVSITLQRLAATPDLAAEIAALKKLVPEGVVRNAAGFPQAFYFDIPGSGTQLHIINDSHEHLMISILGFGDAFQVSGAAERIARRALRRL